MDNPVRIETDEEEVHRIDGVEHDPVWGPWVNEAHIGNIRYCQHPECDLDDIEAWHTGVIVLEKPKIETQLFSVKLPAGENARFVDGCFDKSIGKVVIMENVGPVTIVSAEIIEDGAAAELTFRNGE